MKEKIFYLSHFQINKTLYDKCIIEAIESNLYGFSWYLDIVSPNWGVIIFGNKENYQAVMPIPHRQKYGILHLVQPLFCQQLGVYSRKVLSSEIYESFFQVLFEQFSYVGNYFLNVRNQKPQSSFFQTNFKTKPFQTHHLDLSKSYSEIYQSYHRDRKMNLKRAKKFHQQVIEDQNIEPLIQMFQENTEHKIQGGVNPLAYSFLRQIHEKLQDQKQVRLFYTKTNLGEITSGIMLAFHQNQLIYLFNAGKQLHRKSNGRTLILDQIFQEYAQSDKVFDFESPNVPAIAYFYQSFGAISQPFYRLHYNRLPFWIRTLQRAKQAFFNSNIYQNLKK